MRYFTPFPHTDLRTWHVLYTKAHFGRVSTGRMCPHMFTHGATLDSIAQPWTLHSGVKLIFAAESLISFLLLSWLETLLEVPPYGRPTQCGWVGFCLYMNVHGYCEYVHVYICMCARICIWTCVCECAQSCPTLNPINPPGSSIHGILQARILECFALSFSRGSSRPTDQNFVSCIFCIGGGFFLFFLWLYFIFIFVLEEKQLFIPVEKQKHYFVDKRLSSRGYGFSSIHVWMWELDHKESWALKNLCFWIVVLEKTLERPLDCKIKPVRRKGNQSWIFIGRTDPEAEAPILWPPDVKGRLTGKDPDAGKDWRQEEKGTTEDEVVGWHHWLNGHEFEQDPGVGDGQGSLACCSPWGHKE